LRGIYRNSRQGKPSVLVIKMLAFRKVSPNMSNKIQPEDALKAIDQVLVVDLRNKDIDLTEWHSSIADIMLVDAAPIEVKQLFENAKNVALYTYFAYRLHQSAEAIGYTALEKALKLKYELEKENILIGKSPKTLEDYMNVALNQGWIKSERYNSLRHLASSRVQQKRFIELIKSGTLRNQEPTPIPDAEEHEIIAEMRDMDIAERVLHAGRRVRNFLAHGDGGLSPSAIGTLEKIAEEINQLYSSAPSLGGSQNSTS
tara:strand:+ start:744 stop:1517 length:774 start_codon:yes stop_codon:yes gene_type:complete